MSSESTERIHAATPHRRQLARQQGHLAKSHDLAFAAVFLAGVLLLLLGGSQLWATTPDPTAVIYDPLSGSWTYTTNLPTPRRSSEAAVVDRLIYVIGGHDGTDLSAANEALDFTRWIYLPFTMKH